MFRQGAKTQSEEMKIANLANLPNSELVEKKRIRLNIKHLRSVLIVQKTKISAAGCSPKL